MITTLSTLCFPSHVLACVLFSHCMPLNIFAQVADVNMIVGSVIRIIRVFVFLFVLHVVLLLLVLVAVHPAAKVGARHVGVRHLAVP